MEATDARIVIEVLSPTTEGFDRNDKFERYREMAALESYVLIDPGLRSIEVFERVSGWKPPPRGVRAAPGSSVQLGALSLALLADDIFEGV